MGDSSRGRGPTVGAEPADDLRTGTPRRLPRSFAVFWCVALLSNIAASSQYVAVMWVLGSEELPPTVLLVNQVAGVVGGLLGVAAGARLGTRIGLRRSLVLSSTLEAIGCVVIALVAYDPSGSLGTDRALALAVVTATLPLAAGIGGPAWVALVATWPGTADRTRQLLLDSTQFQLGKFVGPLVGGIVLSATVLAVQWLALSNAITYAAVALVVAFLSRGDEQPTARAPSRSWREASASFVRSPSVWGLAAIAISADAARVFLPRVLRQSGEPQLVYSACVSLLALAAVTASVLASRRSVSTRHLSLLGLGGMCLALVVWSAGDALGPPAWLTGAALLGASVAVASAALTSGLMAEAGPGRQSSAAATAMITRTAIGSGGAAIMAALVVSLGALTFLPLACVAAAVVVAYRSRSQPSDGPAARG